MSVYDDLVLLKSPEAYYKFDESIEGSSYLDSSPNERDIVVWHDTADIEVGVGSWSPYSRKSLSGIPVPFTLETVESLTLEFSVRMDETGKYIFAGVDTIDTVNLRAEVSELVSSPGHYAIKFGIGVGTWDIDVSDTHQHAFCYSNDVTSLVFDNEWHHITLVWQGTTGSQWDTSTIAIYLDGFDVTNVSTLDRYSTSPLTAVPTTFGAPLYITGPQDSDNDYSALFDNFAIYKTALSGSEVVQHFNSTAIIETLVEDDLAEGLVPFTDGYLQTVTELDTVGEISTPLRGLTFEGTSMVTVAAATSDYFAARDLLPDEGALSVNLQGTTLETGEPNAAGYLGTRWYEIQFDPEEMVRAHLTLTSSTSTGKISVYKAPALDNLNDYDDYDEDEIADGAIIQGEPTFSQLVLVATANADLTFTLDQNYGGSYYVQVGRLTGAGTDFLFDWGSADPYPGGTFATSVYVGSGYEGDSVGVTTTNAWLESGEPSASAQVSATRSIWFEWDAPSGTALPTIFEARGTTGSSFEMSIHTGTAVNSLTQVAVDYSLGGPLELKFTPTPSTVYYIRIGAIQDGATFFLNWHQPEVDIPKADPVQHLVVTVHAGMAGVTYGGTTYAANQKITELPNRLSAQFQEAINVPGSGSISLLHDDPVLLAYAPPGWNQRDGVSSNSHTLLGATSSSLVVNSSQVTWSGTLNSSVRPGSTILIGTPGTASAEFATVKGRSNATNTLSFQTPIRTAHASGSQIWGLPRPLDDPYQLLQVGNIIKFWMGSTCVSAFIIKQRDVSIVDGGEESARAISVSGPTVHYLLNDFIVMHDNPDVVLTSSVHPSEMREFNWKSSYVPGQDNWSGSGWFDFTGNYYDKNSHSWNHPIMANTIKSPPGWKKKKTEAAKNRPKYALAKLTYVKKKKKSKKKYKGFPTKDARWMWMDKAAGQGLSPKFTADNYTQHYYRAKMGNIPAGLYKITAHSDTAYEIYLDGVLAMKGNGLENYTKFSKTKTFYLGATTTGNPHTIAVYVGDKNNSYKKKKKKKKAKLVNTKIDQDHNDAFIMAFQRVNSKGKVLATPLVSGGTGKWWAYHGNKPPEWSKAMVLYTLLREAAQRGNQSAAAIYAATRGNFGKVNASGGAWFDEKNKSFSIQVGQSVLDLQASFSEENNFDVVINPDTLALEAYKTMGRNRANNVALVPGQNLIAYSISETDNMKNYLLIQYGDGDTRGFTDVSTDEDSPLGDPVSKYGYREGYLELGGLNNPNDAEDLAEAILASTSDTSQMSGAGDFVGHINESYTGSIIPVDGAVPFLDFKPGDIIAAPGINGLLRSHKVLSLSCTEDSEGMLSFEPELQGE